MPRVSVIIPTFNCERFIAQTIESVLAQTYRDLELVVVDDGSTDNTRLIVEEFLKDKRVRYIYQNNSGASTARNKGFLESSGEYIAFLDSDDLWYPEKLERQVDFLDKNKDIGLVNCMVNIIDKESNIIGREECKEVKGITDLLLGSNLITGSASAVMVRRHCIEKVGLFDPGFFISADLDMWVRILSQFKNASIHKVLGAIRKLPTSPQRDIKWVEKDMFKFLDKYFSINVDMSAGKRRFIYSFNYVNFARAYLKKALLRDFLRTSVIGLVLYPYNIVNLLRASRKNARYE